MSEVEREAARKLVRSKIEAILERMDPRDVKAGKLLSTDAFTVVELKPERRALRLAFARGSCTVQVVIGDSEPPVVVITAVCWDFHQRRSCKHAAGALMALDEELRSGALRPVTEEWLRYAEPPPPEEVLNKLDRLLTSYAPPNTTQKEDWLAWKVSLIADGLRVQPMRRHLKSDGEPSRGVVLSMHSNANDIRQLARTEQDLAVASMMSSGEPSSSWGYYTPSIDSYPQLEVLALLAGHPDVEWTDGTPVQVETLSAGVAVADVENHYEVRLALGGRPVMLPTHQVVDSHGAAAYWQGERRIVVGLWSHQASKLAKELLNARIRVPHAMGAALTQRLTKVQRTLSVVLPTELQGQVLPPDSTPFVVVEPQQPAGAMLRIVVRPLASGPVFTPGQGERELSAYNCDQRMATTRDFEAEITAGSRLSVRLPLEPAHEDPWNRHLTDEEVVELVANLRAPEFADLRIEWPEGAKPKVLSQPIRTMRIQIEAKEDWFGIEGETEIDGVKIDLATIISSLRTGKRFVSLGHGRFVELERAFRDRLARLRDVAHESRGNLQLSAMAAPLAPDVFDGLEIVAPVPWKRLIERVEAARTTTPTPPTELKATLRDYQLDGFQWLWRLSQMGVGGCLADDMGLGKTVQAIAMLLERSAQGPQLVLAPTSVGINWQREIERFAPSLKIIDFRTADREDELTKLGPGNVVIASYGLLRFEFNVLEKVKWTTVVLDEAHAFKNYATQTAKAVRALKSDWKLALTGTPLENHLGELYSLMHTVCPGLLGSWERFAFGFAKPIEKDKDEERRAALVRLLQPFILRRTKNQVLKELPPRTEIELYVALSQQERSMYEAVRVSALAAMEDADETVDSRFIVLAALTRLRQIASHARMIDPSAPKTSSKQEMLMDQLQEVLEEGHTALVFSQFTSHLKLLEEEMHAQGIKTLYLDGTTPAKERQRRVEAFQRGEAKVFLVSLKAGGTGLNLTAADYVFLMDPWWNPAVEDQAADRAHRIGQTRPVTIVRLISTGTVEEKVLSLHAKKRALVTSVLDGADASGKLSTDDLIDLLREGQRPTYQPAHATIEREKARRTKNLGPRAKGA